jgi:predicted rRNA methylase YqxC with S4 and FtsJ domains
MRQLLVQVPQGCGKTVLDAAKACEGNNLAKIEATGIQQPLDLVFVHVSNGKLEKLLERLHKIPDLSFTLLPTGIAVKP